MLRKLVLVASMILALSASAASMVTAAVGMWPTILVELAKFAADKGGDLAVEYFKNKFNKSEELAKEKGAPQLQEIASNDKTRRWVITSASKLNKGEIDELAKALKSLDHGREQSIGRIEEISNTQSGNSGSNMINKTEGPATINQSTIGDISDNASPQIIVNSPGAVQNINRKRTFKKEDRLERRQEAGFHFLDIILPLTDGIWDPGERFHIEVQFSGPFQDYEFVSGLGWGQMNVMESSRKTDGYIDFSTSSAPTGNQVVLRVRSTAPLEIQKIAFSP